MQVIELQSYGDASNLRLSERVKPTPGRGEVVIRVKATSLNPIDPKLASGILRAMFPLQFPFIPGGDFSGVIEAVADDVSNFSVGQEVYGFDAEGETYAAWVAVSTSSVALKPASLSYIEAAAIALVGQTGMQAIDEAGVQAGQTVLVHGAGGAVGSAAVQYAHHLGIKVIGTASATDADRLIGYGAERVIERDTAFEIEVSDIDALIDLVGGGVQTRSLKVLKAGGILVALSQPPSSEQAQQYGVRAVMKSTAASTGSLDALRDLIESGVIVVPAVGGVYPLAEAPHVWSEVAAGKLKGKIVFEPQS